jgi:hypothetical protein
MKCRNFISGLIALPFVPWFAAKIKLQKFLPKYRRSNPVLVLAEIERFRRIASALPPERLCALQQRAINQMIKRWNEQATTTPSDWCKQPFRLD